MIWSKEGIESKDFISLQIHFLRNVHEEMGDSKLFDDYKQSLFFEFKKKHKH